MPTLVDTVAAKMADAYYRETEQRKRKWGHLTPSERSLWRLLSRIAEEEFTKDRVRTSGLGHF